MTTVGHILMGTAIGVLCLPERKSSRWKAAYFFVFALLANIPDLPFPNWGHDRYYLSHSLLVNLLLSLAVVFLLSWRRDIRSQLSGKILVAGVAAWLSHLLLDSLYGNSVGVAIFWPFSDAYLSLPIPWFHVVNPRMTTALLQEFAVEFACYFLLVLLAAGLRRIGREQVVAQKPG
jgi:membrane-bound metal-dependent hydrolase YbcI (DUF457 family)